MPMSQKELKRRKKNKQEEIEQARRSLGKTLNKVGLYEPATKSMVWRLPSDEFKRHLLDALFLRSILSIEDLRAAERYFTEWFTSGGREFLQETIDSGTLSGKALKATMNGNVMKVEYESF